MLTYVLYLQEKVNLVDADDLDDAEINDDEVMAQAQRLMQTYDKVRCGKPRRSK